MNRRGLMFSVLDYLNGSQLPRALDSLLKLARADGFFIDSHFPSDISPLFPISTPFLCLLVSFFSSQPATILKVFIFSCVFKLGFVHCPCSVTESKFVRDNLCTNTLHKAGIWMLPRFFLLHGNAKAEMAFLSNEEHVFVSFFFLLHHLCWDSALTKAPVTIQVAVFQPLPLHIRKKKKPENCNQLMKAVRRAYKMKKETTIGSWIFSALFHLLVTKGFLQW